MSNKRNALNYVLWVNGLFGRNRRVKTDSFPLAEGVDSSTPKALDDLMPLFRAKLAEIKFKRGVARLEEQPVELEDFVEGDRVVTIQTISFSLGCVYGKVLHKEQVG